MAGCGSGGGKPPGGPTLSGNTQLAVLLSSTANGQLSSFDIPINSLTLTNKSGKTVALINSSDAEFIHLNGTATPLVTVTVPQDIYTSAALTFQSPTFLCMSVGSSGGVQANFYGSQVGVQSATVTLPSPITVTGTAMGVTLNLQVSQSATISSCASATSYSLTPTFTLTPAAVSAQPANQANGKLVGIDGRIISSDATANTFNVQMTDCACLVQGFTSGAPLSVSANSNTVFQGVTDVSGLAAGTFIDMDATIQSDGSLLATRIQVWDPTAQNLTIGPLVGIYSSNPAGTGPYFFVLGREDDGDDLSNTPAWAGLYDFDGNTTFQISGEFSNLQNLPFTATFDASHFVAGQNIGVTSLAIVTSGGSYTPATTATLVPQTINGTISSVSTSGNYQVYGVSLPAYDWIPTFNGATSIVAYVDSSTQLLNTKPLTSGNVVRFTGLLFNDNGTLRLVCSQVEDGVAE